MNSSPSTRFTRLKERTQFALLLFGAAWGIYTFVYKDIIVPSRRPPALQLSVTLDELGRSDGMILVRARLVVINSGQATVWVPALWWQAYAIDFTKIDANVSEFVETARERLQGGTEGVSRLADIRAAEIVAIGREASFEYWYHPGDKTTHEQLFHVPEGGGFDVVVVYFDTYALKSIEDFAPTEWQVGADGWLNPILVVKEKGWDEDPSRVTRLDPDSVPAHRRLLARLAAGHNDATASLWIGPAGGGERSPSP